jgi:hypothetical protein
MKTILVTIFLLLVSLCFATQEPGAPVRQRLADSLQGKLDHIQANGGKVQPDQTPTVMTEEEINDYFAAGRVKLPQGVKKVVFEGHSGMVTGQATVDFDEIRAGQHSSNPWLSIFNGTHNVRVDSDAAGANGAAKVHVRKVSIDSIDVPPIALKYFVDKYITPKYPNIGIDSTFQLTNKIDIAIIGYHKLTITQK